jgi:hypothetical protein
MRRGLILSVSLLAAVAAGAQEAKPTTLFGLVTNLNGVPLPRAEVVIGNQDLRVFTNDSGQFIFMNPGLGKVRIAARRLGFRPLEKTFKIEAGENKQLDFELEGVVDQLDSVMIYGVGGTGRMAEFYARRAVGHGVFLTRADIDKRKPYKISDMFRMMSGVRVSGSDDGMSNSTISMGRTPIGTRTARNVQSLAGDCKVSYYLDGSWVPSGTFHPDDISPISIEAVEVYRGPAEIPAKFRQRETACGLIVMWTREPPAKERQPE